MVKDHASKSKYVDNGWPKDADGSGAHAVTEFAAGLSGALSPFGETEFPLAEVDYVQPRTVVNK